MELISGACADTAAQAGSHVSALAGGATAARLRGGRLFLQHGPINLVVHAGGPARRSRGRTGRWRTSFPGWLGALVEELPRLRSPESPSLAPANGPIARRMTAAVAACTSGFVTPMAAVAGAVADEAVAVLAAAGGRARVREQRRRRRPVPRRRCAPVRGRGAVVARGGSPRARRDRVRSTVRGVATSGWQGRSHSLGIADAVTVLARNAAVADAAATLIANAVDADHPGIRRARPAPSTKTATSGTAR